MMLKFEGLKIGDGIRAYDFKPREEIGDQYIEGVITDIRNVPYKAYVVAVTRDTALPEGHRTEVLVPMETSLDWDNRVSKITIHKWELNNINNVSEK